VKIYAQSIAMGTENVIQEVKEMENVCAITAMIAEQTVKNYYKMENQIPGQLLVVR